MTMEEVMGYLARGELKGLLAKVFQTMKQALFGEVSVGGSLMGQVLTLGFLGAVFTNFSTVFQGSQISETGFFITCLLLFTFLTASLFSGSGICGRQRVGSGDVRVYAVDHGSGTVGAGQSDSAPHSRVCADWHGRQPGKRGFFVENDIAFGAGHRMGAEDAAGTRAGIPSDSEFDSAVCGFFKAGGSAESGGHDSGSGTGGVGSDAASLRVRGFD